MGRSGTFRHRLISGGVGGGLGYTVFVLVRFWERGGGVVEIALWLLVGWTVSFASAAALALLYAADVPSRNRDRR